MQVADQGVITERSEPAVWTTEKRRWRKELLNNTAKHINVHLYLWARCVGNWLYSHRRSVNHIHTQLSTWILQKQTKIWTKKKLFFSLGIGESGKSTFAKQMKILHLNGFSEEWVHFIHIPNLYFSSWHI